ncbi:PorP/SprF family type IX secretion system membrane protein [Reichenbachiella agariperforans]|nr:PorP/SprF family type IX secretion system membrane protein [Reichenbachiella agariperforans]
MIQFKTLLILFLTLIVFHAMGQLDNFSLYQFAPFRVNPAYIASDNNVQVSLLHRNQQSMPDVEINSSYLSVKYPFPRRKVRWSSIALEVSDHNEGLEGIFKTNSVSVGYGLNIPLSRYSFMSTGVSMDYFHRGIQTGKLTTGSQYVDDFGFDPSLSLGEYESLFNTNYLTVNWGIHWQSNDKRRGLKDQAGVAFYNITRASETSSSLDNSKLPVLIVFEGTKRIYQNRQVGFFLDMMLRHASPQTLWSVGGTGVYNLERMRRDLRGHTLATSLKYIYRRGLMVGVTWDSPSFAVGASYELPLSSGVGYNSVFELGISLKKPLRYKSKRGNKAKPPRYRPPLPKPSSTEYDTLINDTTKSEDVAIDSSSMNTPYMPEVDTSELVILHPEFEFGSTEPILSPEVRDFLVQVVVELNSNPMLNLEIIGHTDDTGSNPFNHRLSVKRARSIYELLEKLGADPWQMAYKGKGETQPLVENTDDESRAQNRRVEIKFSMEE